MRCDRRLDLTAAGDIYFHRHGSRRLAGCRRGVLAVGIDHARPAGGQTIGNRLADAAGRAGDQAHFARRSTCTAAYSYSREPLHARSAQRRPPMFAEVAVGKSRSQRIFVAAAIARSTIALLRA